MHMSINGLQLSTHLILSFLITMVSTEAVFTSLLTQVLSGKENLVKPLHILVDYRI